MNRQRVAFFADSFLEVNGVAHTCRTLTALAERHDNPFFVVYGGDETEFSKSGSLGNVVLEALTSGVPAVVTADGGPKFIVRSGETGFIAQTDSAFLRCVLELARDRVLACKMGLAAPAAGDGNELGCCVGGDGNRLASYLRPAGFFSGLKVFCAPADRMRSVTDSATAAAPAAGERPVAHPLAHARRRGHSWSFRGRHVAALGPVQRPDDGEPDRGLNSFGIGA